MTSAAMDDVVNIKLNITEPTVRMSVQEYISQIYDTYYDEILENDHSCNHINELIFKIQPENMRVPYKKYNVDVETLYGDNFVVNTIETYTPRTIYECLHKIQHLRITYSDPKITRKLTVSGKMSKFVPVCPDAPKKKQRRCNVKCVIPFCMPLESDDDNSDNDDIAVNQDKEIDKNDKNVEAVETDEITELSDEFFSDPNKETAVYKKRSSIPVISKCHKCKSRHQTNIDAFKKKKEYPECEQALHVNESIAELTRVNNAIRERQREQEQQEQQEIREYLKMKRQRECKNRHDDDDANGDDGDDIDHSENTD